MKKFLLFLVTLFIVFQATILTPISLSFSASQTFVGVSIVNAQSTPAASTGSTLGSAAKTVAKTVISTVSPAAGVLMDGYEILGGLEGIQIRIMVFVYTVVVLPIFGFINELVIIIFNGLLNFSVDGSLLGSGSPIGDGIEFGWIIFRDILNIGIIFLLMFHAIKIILNRDDQVNTGLIIKIIVAGVLTNFSLFFVRVFIDISNLFIITIYSNIITAMHGDVNIGENISTHFGAGKLMMDSGKWIGFDLGTAIKMMSMVYLTIALYIVSIIVFSKAIMVLATRLMVLIILMITSPIIFLGPVFKDTSKQLKELNDGWWREMAGQMIALPAFLIFLLVVVSIMNSRAFETVWTAALKRPDISLSDYFLPLLLMGILYAAGMFIKKYSSQWGQAVVETVKTAVVTGVKYAAVGTAAVVTGGAALGAGAATAAGNTALAARLTGVQKLAGGFVANNLPSTGNKLVDKGMKGAFSDNGLLGVNTDGRTMIQRNFTDKIDNVDKTGRDAIKARNKASAKKLEDDTRERMMKDYEKATEAHKNTKNAQASIKEDMNSEETATKIKTEAAAITASALFQTQAPLLAQATAVQTANNKASQKMEEHKEAVNTNTKLKAEKATEREAKEKENSRLDLENTYIDTELTNLKALPVKDTKTLTRITELSAKKSKNIARITQIGAEKAAIKSESDKLDQTIASINAVMAADQTNLDATKAAVEAMFTQLQAAGFNTDEMKDEDGGLVTDVAGIAKNRVTDQKAREYSGMSMKELEAKEQALEKSAEVKRQIALKENQKMFSGSKNEKELATKLANELRLKVRTISEAEYGKRFSNFMKDPKNKGKGMEDFEAFLDEGNVKYVSQLGD